MATNMPPAGSTQQPIKDDWSKFMGGRENMMTKTILATHHPDDSKVVEVEPLLDRVEEILKHALNVDINNVQATEANVENMEDNIDEDSSFSTPDSPEFIINQIWNEIESRNFGGMDAHPTRDSDPVISLFHGLSGYSWDAKLVLTLAAFALNYGNLILLLTRSNPLAKSLAKLKKLADIRKQPWFDGLNNLVKAMLDVTRCIVEFNKLPSMYITDDVQANAVGWTIKSIVAGATKIHSLAIWGIENELMTMGTEQLPSLAQMLNNIHDHLKKQLEICNQRIEEERNNEAYKKLLDLIEMNDSDNMKILKALIYDKDDLQPLVDGSTKRRVNIKVLKGKHTLLLISGLNISHDELSILEQIYNEYRHNTTWLKSQYEVVWIPIVDLSVRSTDHDPMQKQFESLQSTMPWYTVHQLLKINQGVIRFIKEVWHFRKKPILVVLDPQGRVVCPNAIHMMWIWGSSAFPFTSLREEALWKEETWRLDLLVNGIDPTILNWIGEGKYIFLYGGDDIEWIQKFTSTARNVAKAAHIPLEMVYVGKSSKWEKVRRVVATITAEKLSYYWQDLTMIWFFWTRLESMLFSKIQQGQAADKDPMMLEIKKLLSHDKAGGWAVLSKGSSVVLNGHGTTVLPALLEYDLWKELVPVKGFDVSFKDHHDKLHAAALPCCRFEFPSTIGRIPENMKCPECLHLMEKFITFLCCHDEN